MKGQQRTDLLAQLVPAKPWQILHRPDVVLPALTLPDRLGVEHFRDRTRDALVEELDPTLLEVVRGMPSLFLFALLA